MLAPRSPSRALLAAALLACAGCPPRANDTGEPDDTGEPWPGLDALGPEQLQPPEGLWQARHFTVPPDRGLEWEIDPDFFIDNVTVPHIVVLGDGSFMMMATNMEQPEGRWTLTSDDGLEWTMADQPLFLGSDFPQDCGNRVEDGTAIYAPNGTMRLILEGTWLDEETGWTDKRAWCQASSGDGLSFEPIEGYFYEGSDNDGSLPSVPSPLHLSNWSALIYYMGDIYSEVGGFEHGNGIRVAHTEPDADQAEPWITDNVLPQGQMDPMPVYLEGGGMRLYHTSTEPFGGDTGPPGPGPGFTEATDGRSFGEVTRILPIDGNCFEPPGGECMLDPFFLHLDDGTLVLYYTYLQVESEVGEPENWISVGIGRAFASD